MKINTIIIPNQRKLKIDRRVAEANNQQLKLKGVLLCMETGKSIFLLKTIVSRYNVKYLGKVIFQVIWKDTICQLYIVCRNEIRISRAERRSNFNF